MSNLKPGRYYGCVIRRDRKPQIFFFDGQWLYTGNTRVSRKRYMAARLFCTEMNAMRLMERER